MTMTARSELPALMSERYQDAVASRRELVRALAEDESVPETMQSILKLALRSVPGCHGASVTVLDDEGKPSTLTATDEEAYELDRRQNALRDGPCLDAARRQQ